MFRDKEFLHIGLCWYGTVCTLRHDVIYVALFDHSIYCLAELYLIIAFINPSRELEVRRVDPALYRLCHCAIPPRTKTSSMHILRAVPHSRLLHVISAWAALKPGSPETSLSC